MNAKYSVAIFPTQYTSTLSMKNTRVLQQTAQASALPPLPSPRTKPGASL